MNLLSLNPISSCNLQCRHCPNKKWTYPVDDEHNRLNNEIIFKWLNKYCNPYEWFLEISGGEPGMYREISDLILKLSSMGYYGIIRTNGTLPIPKADNFIRLAAWHKQTDISHPPKSCDVMLITKNPDDCWEEKARYCEDNSIPYKCIPYKRFGDPDFEDDPIHGDVKINTFFKHWTIISSTGGLAYCYANWGKEEDNIINMTPPLMRDMMSSCQNCGGMLGLLEFMDDDFRQMLALRRDNYVYSNSE